MKNMDLSCKRIKELIKDEKMASTEYAKYARQSKHMLTSQMFQRMSSDEKRHHKNMKEMYETICPK
jgi:rubrerythrin